MVYTPVPNGVAVVLHWQFNGTIAGTNALNARNVTSQAITQTLANAVDADIKAALGSSNLSGALTTSSSLLNVGLRDLSTSLPSGEFVGAGAAQPGTASTTELPPNLALCVSLRTQFAGRSFRGRYYQGGFTQGANDPTNGQVTVTAAAAALAFVTAIINNLRSSHGLQIAVLSRVHNKAPVVPPALYDVLNALVVDHKWDHIDRRKQ
jgi:hypothetical protein